MLFKCDLKTLCKIGDTRIIDIQLVSRLLNKSSYTIVSYLENESPYKIVSKISNESEYAIVTASHNESVAPPHSITSH